jgi:hypothetical protein
LLHIYDFVSQIPFLSLYFIHQYLKNFDDLNEKEKGRIIEDVMADGLGVENQNVISDDYNSPVDLGQGGC